MDRESGISVNFPVFECSAKRFQRKLDVGEKPHD